MSIHESITAARNMLESKPGVGPAPDRPASAVVTDGLHCRVEGPESWALVTDMPGAVGGEGSAPTPAWLLRAAWASCAATAIAMRAAELGVSLTRLEVTAESETDMRGLLGVGNGVAPGPESGRLKVEIASDEADERQLNELVAYADGHSPVADALRRAVHVELDVVTG